MFKNENSFSLNSQYFLKWEKKNVYYWLTAHYKNTNYI